MVRVPDKQGRYFQTFVISHFMFYIAPEVVKLREGCIVQVRCDLHDGVHPHRHALKSRDTDPSARLGINVKGTDINGRLFGIWLETKGGERGLQDEHLRGLSRRGRSRDFDGLFPTVGASS